MKKFMVRKIYWLGLVLLAGLLLAACESTPSTGDFNVSVQNKTADHPEFGEGSSVGYVVNGEEGGALTLTRGTTYTFAVDAPGHPFYLTTDPVGGPGAPGEITDGVDNSQAEDGILTFTPTADTPNLIYYQCSAHPNMGWQITVVD